MPCGWTGRVKATAHPCLYQHLQWRWWMWKISISESTTNLKFWLLSSPPPLPLPTSRRLFGSRPQKCNSISNCQSLEFCLIKYVRSSHLRPHPFNSVTLLIQSPTKVDLLCFFPWLNSWLHQEKLAFFYFFLLHPLNIFIMGFSSEYPLFFFFFNVQFTERSRYVN
jgi:hypothetical protein